MSYFKKYLLRGYDPQAPAPTVMFDSLDEAVKHGQMWADQDIYGRLHIAIYQLVEVIKDEPTSQKKEQMGNLAQAKA